MDTQRALGIALLIGGIILIVLGMDARNSFASDVSEMVTGAPTDRSIWMLVSGAIATITGAFMTLGDLVRR